MNSTNFVIMYKNIYSVEAEFSPFVLLLKVLSVLVEALIFKILVKAFRVILINGLKPVPIDDSP
ncbi:hypothetical protein SAMN05880574_11438 [Chryseobacterium sp. RU37D]|nr:hypothetical protein SAMN05880574_11438 [Chryseobacterium sp. RU37D]